MVGIFRVNIRNAIVQANPFVSMIVSSHTIVQHISSLLKKEGQSSGSSGILGILGHMLHHQNYLFAHDCALNSGISAVQQVPLILFDGLLGSILQDLFWCSVF